MFNPSDIKETLGMVKDQKLDVRTVTMAVSILDCVSDSPKKCAQRVYDKVARSARSLVPVCRDIEREYGIPIVNKRVSVTPVALVGAASGGYEEIALALDRAGEEIGVDYVGGYSALVQKGITDAESAFLGTVPHVLASTKKL